MMNVLRFGLCRKTTVDLHHAPIYCKNNMDHVALRSFSCGLSTTISHPHERGMMPNRQNQPGQASHRSICDQTAVNVPSATSPSSPCQGLPRHMVLLHAAAGYQNNPTNTSPCGFMVSLVRTWKPLADLEFLLC